MNRGNEAQPIARVIRELLEDFHLNTRFDEARLLGSWEQTVGKPIARRTRKLFMKKKVLYIQLDSPSLKNDFMLNKSHVLGQLQRDFGADAIADIVLL